MRMFLFRDLILYFCKSYCQEVEIMNQGKTAFARIITDGILPLPKRVSCYRDFFMGLPIFGVMVSRMNFACYLRNWSCSAGESRCNNTSHHSTPSHRLFTTCRPPRSKYRKTKKKSAGAGNALRMTDCPMRQSKSV